MKEIKSKYTNRMVDNKYYDIIIIPSDSCGSQINNENIIFLPYTITTSDDSSNEYNEFMEEYQNLHECCPKCGSDIYATTLVGYILDLNNKDKYQDKNICYCEACGDQHIYHERVKRN